MNVKEQPKPHHNDWGEAWVYCTQCMAKLYSTDGNNDYAINCPHEKKCRDERM